MRVCCPVLLRVAAGLAVLLPAAAYAQQPLLLGQGGPTTLTGSVQTYGGYDRADSRTRSGAIDLSHQGDGTSAGATGLLALTSQIGHGTFTANGSSDLRYYATAGALTGITADSSRIAAAIGTPLARRVTNTVGLEASSSSFYQYDPFSGLVSAAANDVVLATSDYRLVRGRSFAYSAHDGVEIQTGRYTMLSMDYRARYVQFPTEEISYFSQGGGARLQHRLTRHTSFRSGYGYDYGGAVRGARGTGYHSIDLGVDYDSRLSFSRSTYVNATTGAAVISTRDAGDGRPRQVGRLTVAAGLRQQLGRSWMAGVQYRREPQHIEIYANPSYSDIVAGSLRGQMSRRVSLLVAGGYSRSALDAGTSDLANQTMFGSMRMSVTATRRLAAYVEYGYYGFESSGTMLAHVVSSRVGRQAVRGGFSWSVPLITPRQLP